MLLKIKIINQKEVLVYWEAGTTESEKEAYSLLF